MVEKAPFIVYEKETPKPLVQPIHVSRTLTPDEFFRGRQKVQYGTFEENALPMIILLPVVILIFFLRDSIQFQFQTTIAIVIFLLAVLFAGLLNIQLLARRSAKRPLGQFAGMDIEFSEEGMKTRQENHTTEVLWPFYKRCILSDQFLVLVAGGYPKNYRVIPRRMFQNNDDWNAIVGLLKRKSLLK